MIVLTDDQRDQIVKALNTIERQIRDVVADVRIVVLRA
jgi:hypothetical protein